MQFVRQEKKLRNVQSKKSQLSTYIVKVDLKSIESCSHQVDDILKLQTTCKSQ